MQKTKIAIALLATSFVVVALIGVTFALYVNAQPQSSTYYSPSIQAYAGSYGYMAPVYNNGATTYLYPQGSYQHPYGYYCMGMGRGRCR